MANRKDHEQRLVKQAREIAETGRHNGWFWIACQLRRDGEPLALDVLGSEPFASELDRRCAEARRRLYGEPYAQGS